MTHDSLADMLRAMRKAKLSLFCALCGHPVHRYGVLDWRCDEGCHCMMAGCALDRERMQNDLNSR